MRRGIVLTLAVQSLLLVRQAGAVGTWLPLANTPGTYGGHMLLLSDATVMVQSGGTQNWFRLTPDSTGGYINGTWTNLAPMGYNRFGYASVVLRDGRVFVAGGESPDNGPQQTNSQIYDPVNNNWIPTGSAGSVAFNDSGSVILPDGTVLVHPKLYTNQAPITMLFDPTHKSWTVGPHTKGPQAETSWVKLPDDSIVTIDRNSTTSERYIPVLNDWFQDGSVPINMWGGGETGAALLLPDGRAFFLGASGHTAIYTASPLGGTNAGTWAQGPDIPDGRFADDCPAAMMVNGKILCAVGASAPNGGSPPPMWFYEYDYNDHKFHQAASPGNPVIGSSFNYSHAHFLDLPDGTVLFSDPGDPAGQLYVYQPDTLPLTSGKPTIKSVSVNGDGSLHLSGTLFNGISQGASFGDDWQQDSNFPLVRFTAASGKVFYGRTSNWSSTGVMTSSKIVSTESTVPAAVAGFPGTYLLQVVANGNASDPFVLVVNGNPSDPFTLYEPAVWVDFNYSGSPQLGTYPNPFPTLAQGVTAVPSGGIIAFKANVQPSVSHETKTISKPMTLIAVGGPATIGQ